MKTTLALLFLLTAPSAAFACNDHDHQGERPRPAAKATASIAGTVREVDVERRSVALAHGPIPGIRMKRMESMVVKVAPSISLDHLKPGDAIRFRLDVVGGVPVASEIVAR